MYQPTYYVDKTTDTFADVLLAYGVASLLERLLQANVGETTVRVRDAGSAYAIILEAPIEEGFEKMDWFCDLPFIHTRSKRPPAGWPGVVVDYDAEWARFTEYRKAREQLSREARRPSATVDEYPELAAVLALAPPPDWDILTQINQMQAITAYTQVLTAWLACRACFPDLLSLLLALFANTPNDVDEALATWQALSKEYGLEAKDTVTPVQVLNPGMGKGINRPKADGAHRLGNPDSFWPLEFLKFWGMRRAGVPRIIQTPQPMAGRGPRDRKTYILRPANITLDTHDKIYRRFNRAMWASTAVKMDVLAVLRYTDAFLGQWLAGQLSDVRWGEEPGDYVNSLATVFYKDLGQGVAVLNLSEIALPHWMSVETPEQGRAYQALIDEHQGIVSGLQERNADEYRLLESYRDFLSGHDLRAFFEVTGIYAGYVMSRMERRQLVRRFTTTNLEVLIMGHDHKLKPILESPGFQNVAAAIRRSTVTPQFFKARGKTRLYDIRYGLGTELLRQAAYPDRFIQALSEFMHAYNQENAQINERYKGNPPVRRANITTEDIEQVVDLTDEYGSKTVANLLVAYGYAREPREQEPEVVEAPPEEGEEVAEE
ncbi:MAG: hypothetical protein FJ014_15150 [Chloroflexi bacterium]|nr:hypothetical protein [Chloroflexota bacterium]